MNTTCAISGGGPAGMMLALLLARNGIDVVVLEKHADFFRDFRGDTIHPSTIGVLGELGLRDAFLGLPHTSIRTLDAVVDGTRLHPIDFGRLRPPDDFLVLAPQWDFLTFLAEQGERSPSFHLRTSTEATGLIWEDGEVRGLTAEGPEGPVRIQADLTIAADGRDSVLRAAAGLRPRRYGVPIDVLWFRLPKPEAAPPSTLAYIGTFKPEQIDASEAREITLPLRTGEVKTKGQPYLLHFAFPNFWFHVTTAYAILRHNGVDIGKTDFVGPLPT